MERMTYFKSPPLLPVMPQAYNFNGSVVETAIRTCWLPLAVHSGLFPIKSVKDVPPLLDLNTFPLHAAYMVPSDANLICAIGTLGTEEDFTHVLPPSFETCIPLDVAANIMSLSSGSPAISIICRKSRAVFTVFKSPFIVLGNSTQSSSLAFFL